MAAKIASNAIVDKIVLLCGIVIITKIDLKPVSPKPKQSAYFS